MSDSGGGGASNSPGAPLNGAFLLQLLRRPPRSLPEAPAAPPLPHEGRQPHRDPAVAAVGPSYPFPPHSFLPHPRPPPPPPQDHYLEPPHFASPPFFPRGPWAPPAFPVPGADFITRPSPSDPRSGPGYPQRDGVRADNTPHSSSRNLGSRGPGDTSMRNRPRKAMAGSGTGGDDGVGSRREMGRSPHPGPGRHGSFPRSGMPEPGRPPAPFHRFKGSGEWVTSKGRRDEMHSGEKVDDDWKKDNSRPSPSCSEADRLQGERSHCHGSDGGSHPNSQLDQSRDASGSNLRSFEGLDSEEYLNHSQYENAKVTVSEVRRLMKHGAVDDFASKEDVCEEQVMLADQLMDSPMMKHDPADKKVNRGKDVRSDSLRGHQVSSQRMRICRRETECRHDIESLASSFLSIYESLIPADEEKEKQKQLLLSLEKLVTKEWPNAKLHLYGSCANSFGFSNSDIDICLAIDDINMSKSEILLKLADILQADNLENVQALTHARVPIVKMTDPVTGISCDICINNLLAVVNTKLLRDYAQIDERLRQLAFIVKHWAKSRGVNETYRGTLSSYAYVLMCIHFLQLRKPAILPCLQEMAATYAVIVDDTKCSYFDQVEKLHKFGAQNKENIAQLLWAFFHYWAYYHDYIYGVISVRTRSIISKRVKDWTRRIGNDRHLICIEDPFEISHDLGRVVDKFSIKILREEFERAADILQYDPNPSVTLFEPYVPGSTQN